ncbi:MAG: Uma2 family endonuclease [Pseudomonadota bacterium]
MNSHVQLRSVETMTAEDFLAMIDARPANERWELIDGVAIMSPAPVDVHQLIFDNIVFALRSQMQALGAQWLPMSGTNTRVPRAPDSLPIPDVLVKDGPPTGSDIAEDVRAVFAVLSPSNTAADQSWRRETYCSIDTCAHVVMIAQDAYRIEILDRATGWTTRELAALDDTLTLADLGVSIPVRDIYLHTPVDSAG